MNDLTFIKDRVIIVTGANGHIGTALCKSIVLAGGKLVTNDIHPVETEDYPLCTIVDIPGRLTTASQSRSIIKAGVRTFGRVDALIHCVGAQRDGLIHRMDGADWEYVIQTNLHSAYLMVNAFTEHMVKIASMGNMLLFSSGVAAGATGQSSYAAAKAGLLGFMRSVAKDMCRHNVTCNAVLPSAPGPGSVLPSTGDRNASHVIPLLLYLLSRYSCKLTGKAFSIVGNKLAIVPPPVPINELYLPKETVSFHDIGKYIDILI